MLPLSCINYARFNGFFSLFSSIIECLEPIRFKFYIFTCNNWAWIMHLLCLWANWADICLSKMVFRASIIRHTFCETLSFAAQVVLVRVKQDTAGHSYQLFFSGFWKILNSYWCVGFWELSIVYLFCFNYSLCDLLFSYLFQATWKSRWYI